MEEDDLVAKGFHRLDPELIENKPPTISWGKKYQEMSDKKKIEYLEKLAASMNHAAHLIQTERNELGKLCEAKEQQLMTMSGNMDANNNMMQQQIILLNEERQTWNKAAAEMKTRIRKLESVNIEE